MGIPTVRAADETTVAPDGYTNMTTVCWACHGTRAWIDSHNAVLEHQYRTRLRAAFHPGPAPRTNPDGATGPAALCCLCSAAITDEDRDYPGGPTTVHLVIPGRPGAPGRRRGRAIFEHQ